MEMGDAVWMSNAFVDSTLVLPAKTDIALTDLKSAAELQGRNDLGEPIRAELFPKEAYARPGMKLKPSKGLVNINGFLGVSSECAKIFCQFYLGEGAFYPIKLFQDDHATPVEGEYFCINWGNLKNALIPERSPGIETSRHLKEGVFCLRGDYGNDDIAVSRAALKGPDIWLDPQLTQCFFISDRLAKSLAKVKLIKGFKLKRCLVV